MKIRIPSSTRRHRGYALLLVVAFTAGGLLVLGGALNWCSTNTRLNARSNQYQNAIAAAEAATEKVMAGFVRDFQLQGEGLVYANLNTYRAAVPTAAENPWWSQYAFSDAQGGAGRTYVARTEAAAFKQLESQYSGLYGYASRYRIISNARTSGPGYAVAAGVRQEVQLAQIPIFQFAIFYTMNLEINPGPNMVITGRVHSNTNIYAQPVSTLTFMSDVTAAGTIILNKHPDDPSSRGTSGQVIFNAEHDSQAPSLMLPVGTNNSPDAVHAIIEVPPDSESPNAAMGQQRFYNKADLVVLVSNTTVTVTSGRIDNFATTVPAAQWTNFISTTPSFYDRREAKTVKATQVDVGRLATWSQTNSAIRAALGYRDVNCLYVADMRTPTSSTIYGVRLVNGQTLPSLGLTVAAPNPIYVQGHYNVPAAALGTHNTSQTKPAALIGDAITVLSTAWNDANSSKAISYRTAANTTVNAAFLAGIVPTGGGYYSGGVENFPRFLENWSGRTLTYNGSMVVMFPSTMADAPWPSTGAVYNPPTRDWAFDVNFTDSTKLPPGTPQVRALVRAQWATVKPDSTL